MSRPVISLYSWWKSSIPSAGHSISGKRYRPIGRRSKAAGQANFRRNLSERLSALRGAGQLIHQASPSDKPTRPEFIEEVIRHANDALSPATRTSGYAARYQQGDRNLDFLINYAKYAKTTRDTLQLIALADEFGRIFTQPADLESPYGFYIISRFISDFNNPMAQYFSSISIPTAPNTACRKASKREKIFCSKAYTAKTPTTFLRRK